MFKVLSKENNIGRPLDEKRVRRLVIASTVVPVTAMCVLTVLLLWQIQRLISVTQWVDHADRVIAEANLLERYMVQTESSLRGYLLTDESHYLDAFNVSTENARAKFDELAQLTDDDPVQQSKLIDIRRSFRALVANSLDDIRKNKIGGDDTPEITTNHDQMNQVRESMDSFIDEESGLRLHRFQVSQQTARTLYLSGIFLFIVVTASFFLYSSRGLRRLYVEFGQINDDLKHSRDELNIILKNISEGITVLDQSGQMVFANDAAARMSGYQSVDEYVRTPVEVVMKNIRVLDDKGSEIPLRETPPVRILRGERVEGEHLLRVLVNNGATNDQDERWLIMTSSPIHDSGGRVQFVINIFRDFTERKKIEEYLKKAEENARFLSEAGRVLVATLDYEKTFQNVANLVVSQMADWCVVALSGEADPRQVVVAHPDPDRLKWAREIQEKYPTDWNAKSGAPQVIRTGESEIYPLITDEMIVGAARDEEHLKILRELGMASVMIVPLRGREGPIGAITFISADPRRRYTNADVRTAEQLGRMAGLAVENSRNFLNARSRANRLAALQGITESLSTAVTSREVAEYAVMEGMRSLGAWGGSFLTYAAENHALVPRVVLNYEPIEMVPDQEISLGEERLITKAARKRTSEFIEGAESGKSEAAVPIVVRDELLGIIAFVFTGKRHFDEDEKRFIAAIGRQCGLALERSALYENLRRAVRSRDEFLSIASHELKTPLTPLKLQIQTLSKTMKKEGALSRDRLTYMADVSDRQVDRLTRLIDDLLDVSRVSSGKLQLELERANLGDLVRDTIQRYSVEMTKAGCRVELDLEPKIVLQVDRLRFEQVLSNLLTNAAKYAPGSDVLITLKREGENAVLTVRDNGAGIPADRLPHIFDRFERVHTTRAVEGLGLGLYISRQIIQAHEGTIEVKSREGEGTVFTIRLPLSLKFQTPVGATATTLTQTAFPPPEFS